MSEENETLEEVEPQTKLFVYRKKELVREPLSDYLCETLHNALGMVVTIVGQYESRASGLHLGAFDVAAYHDPGFQPTVALVMDDQPVKIQRIGQRGKYRTYRLPIRPNDEIVSVETKIRPEDAVFQIGVRNFRHRQVTYGVVEPLLLHLDTEEERDIQIDVCAESGSGVFTEKGGIIGMTLGKISPDIMVATSIDRLLMLS